MRASPLFFFESFGPGPERGFQGLSQEVAALTKQERLATINHLPLGGRVGRTLQFLGEEESLFDHEPLQGSEAIKIGG